MLAWLMICVAILLIFLAGETLYRLATLWQQRRPRNALRFVWLGLLLIAGVGGVYLYLF